MPICQSTGDVYAIMMEREVKSCTLYRFVAKSVQDEESKTLLERLAQRAEEYLEKLEASKRRGHFENRPCSLTDSAFYTTILQTGSGPGHSAPEILMFAISNKHDGYLKCREAAQQCQDAEQKKLWLALAEEERRHRLELESYYEKEVIYKI